MVSPGPLTPTLEDVSASFVQWRQLSALRYC